MPPKIPHALRKLMDFNGVGQKDAAPSVVETLATDEAKLFSSRNVRAVRIKQEQEKEKTAVKAEGDSSTKVCKKKKMICIDSELSSINNCNAVTKLFKTCAKCEENKNMNKKNIRKTHGN